MNYKAAFLGDSGGSGDFVDWGVKCIGVGIEGGGEGRRRRSRRWWERWQQLHVIGIVPWLSRVNVTR